MGRLETNEKGNEPHSRSSAIRPENLEAQFEMKIPPICARTNEVYVLPEWLEDMAEG